MDSLVFDASSILAYLWAEDGAEAVEALLRQCRDGVAGGFIHAINLAEVEYKVHRADAQVAPAVQGKLRHLLKDNSIAIENRVGVRLRSLVVDLKKDGKISLADAVCVALAIRTGSEVVSSDRHEMQRLEAEGRARFRWFREPPTNQSEQQDSAE